MIRFAVLTAFRLANTAGSEGRSVYPGAGMLVLAGPEHLTKATTHAAHWSKQLACYNRSAGTRLRGPQDWRKDVN